MRQRKKNRTTNTHWRTTLLALVFGALAVPAQAQSYINRLFQQKKYDEVVAFSSSGESRSGADNMRIGQSFMALGEPAKALEHYDLAVAKKWQSEDLFYYRFEAQMALEQYGEALDEIEVCLTMRPTYQKYLLGKADAAYQSGDLGLALATHETLIKLYDKHMPYHMRAVILIELERYREAREQVNQNLELFDGYEHMWPLAAEQKIFLEWRVFDQYENALAVQRQLSQRTSKTPVFHINELLLLRLLEREEEAAAVEEAFLQRYNNSDLPHEYYTEGKFLVAQYFRPNGIIEDYRYFRPRFFEGKKYDRYYIGQTGRIIQQRGAKTSVDSTSAVHWEFMNRYRVPTNDTSYVGFRNLFELDEERLEAFETAPAAAVDTVGGQ